MNTILRRQIGVGTMCFIVMAGPAWAGSEKQAAPDKSVSQEVWIGLRNDGKDGAGSQADPRDGSTQEKFDSVLAGFHPPSMLPFSG